MTRPRVKETDQGIRGEFSVRMYDQMQRRLRDKGWMATEAVIASGIDAGLALEIGPGPGYLGLEWLKKTSGTQLRGAEISPDMIAVAEANARAYGLGERTRYVRADAQTLPFADDSFDAVFSSSSLHEWSEPTKVFDEIGRVLRPGGRYFIRDLRRDVSLPVRWFLMFAAKPKAIRPGLISSLNAAFTPKEAAMLAQGTALRDACVKANPFGVEISGEMNNESTPNRRYSS